MNINSNAKLSNSDNGEKLSVMCILTYCCSLLTHVKGDKSCE